MPSFLWQWTLQVACMVAQCLSINTLVSPRNVSPPLSYSSGLSHALPHTSFRPTSRGRHLCPVYHDTCTQWCSHFTTTPEFRWCGKLRIRVSWLSWWLSCYHLYSVLLLQNLNVVSATHMFTGDETYALVDPAPPPLKVTHTVPYVHTVRTPTTPPLILMTISPPRTPPLNFLSLSQHPGRSYFGDRWVCKGLVARRNENPTLLYSRLQPLAPCLWRKHQQPTVLSSSLWITSVASDSYV